MEATAQMGTPKSKDPPTPIAIVGIGCRFSGGADSPEKLWQLLASGESTWSPIPKERWNSSSFFDPNPSQQGMHNSYGGHFLSSDPAAIDAGFWGLAAAECEALDPQHRVQLEVAYEALENAGITRQDIEGSDTAVYVGTFGHDYESMLLQDTSDLPKYHMVGIGTAIAANRISYQLDLRGPSVTIDTGCSGSLVAIHQACQSLRTEECSMALAGGVNLLLNPDQTVAMSLMRCFSEEGKCYSFDSRGTGYGRGEGAAIVALKRLDDAIRDGNPIRAVIRNSGVGQDGKTKGIMVPNSEAQKSLIESVYREAKLDPRDTPVVEAHGTGTQVGDPLEVSAIREAFRDSDGSANQPLYLGSIKPNIGHLESASGIASLIKGVVMLENRKVPATIGIEKVKPSLRLDEFGMQIPDQCVEWPANSIQRLSVNNFGYGGTNAHVILDAAPAEPDDRGEDCYLSNAPSNGFANETSNGHSEVESNGLSHSVLERVLNGDSISNGAVNGAVNGAINGGHETVVSSGHPQIIPLTAESLASLNLLCHSIASWASVHPSSSSSPLEDLAYTLTARRTPMRHRITFPARSLADVISQCSSSNTIPPTKSSVNPGLAFIFTGQGAQYATMARSLIDLISPFRTSLQRSEDILLRLGANWSLLSELNKEEANTRIHEPELSQAVTCAVQIALVDLFAFLGVTPDVVLGHSSGEIAAAYACGAIDQESALAVAWYRGRCTQLQGAPGKTGAMLAVGLGEVDCLLYLHGNTDDGGRAVIACANSPTSSTLSGDVAAIDKIEAALKADGVFARRLKVDRAYHSHHMQDVASQYFSDIQGLSFGSPNGRTTFISSVTGQAFDVSFSAQYWVDNLVSKVRFVDASYAALKILSSSSRTRKPVHHLLVEIGAHNALAGPVRQTLSTLSLDETTSQHTALIRGQDAITTITALVGSLFSHGSSISLASLNSILRPSSNAARRRRVLTSLPSYPWNHSTRYWHESRLSLAHRFRQFPYHDLLGLQIPGQNAPRPVWRHIFGLKTHPWLQEHMIDGSMIFPASGYIAMVIEAMRQIHSSDPANTKSRNRHVRQYELRNVIFVSPLVVPEDGANVELMLQLVPVDGSLWEDFRIIGHNKEGLSTEHCHGSVTANMELAADEVEGERELNASRASAVESFNAVASSAMKSIDTVTFYRNLRKKGNAYGPHFACMTDLSTNGSQAAFSAFRIPDMAQSMNGATMRPHLIHPAVLDAILHPSIAVADVGDVSRSVVTAAIGSLTISSSLSSTIGSTLRSCTKLTDQWSQSCTADVSVFQFDATDNPEPVLQIQGLRLQGLGLSDSTDSEANSCDSNYLIKWDIDADYLRPRDIDPYPAAETEEISRAQAHKLHTLNQASALYIDKCLQEIPNHPNLAIVGNYQRLVKWMERFRASHAYTDLVSPIPPASGIQMVLEESSTMGVEGEILARIGENLLAIVSGETEPLNLFTEQDLLWRLYADDASVRCYGYAIEYMRHLVFKNPNMKVLEIGGGTGGATEPILEALSSDQKVFPFASYDFTDVSAGFFERSKKRLEKWEDKMRFKKLDLQEDPSSQGFEEGTYDLVIAANVLHVAHHIDEALSRVKKLLRSGGRVLLIETTRNVPFLNTAIGVLPGWWGAQDGRLDGPLLTEEQWDAAFVRNGLGGLSIVAQDFEGSAHRCSVIVSKPMATPSFSPLAGRSIEILLPPAWEGESEDLVNRLVSDLQANAHNVTSTSLGEVSLCSDKVYVLLDNGKAPVLKTKDAAVFKSIVDLVASPISLIWLSVSDKRSWSANPETGMITGFARVARFENTALKVLTVNVQDPIDDEQPRRELAQIVEKLVQTVSMPDLEQPAVELDCAFKNGQLHIQRVVPHKALDDSVAASSGTARIERQAFHQSARSLRLSLDKPQLSDKLVFKLDDSLQGELPAGYLEIRVEAFGVNFKDVLIARGHTKKKLEMAGEFAGIVIKVATSIEGQYREGDRVCGYGATPYAGRIRVRADTIAKLPPSMPLAVGAAIPVVFATAYHALVDIARLEEGQKVLIHSAAGGVGQAAISIAKWIGAEVFVTVSNAAKKEFLVAKFGIPEANIFSSRQRSFKEGIKRLTSGEGVDVVLNSLSGQTLQDSLDCVARFGTFVEIGKTDIHLGSRVSMAPFDSNITLAAVDLSMVHKYRPAKSGQLVQKVVSLIAEDQLQMPAPLVKPLEEMGSVFRSLQTRTHMGKIVVDAGRTAMVEGPATTDKVALSENATFVVAGGRSGMGLEVGKYLARQGASHLVLLSRRAVTAEEETRVSESFRETKAQVTILSCDISDKQSVQTCLASCLKSLPPVRGVVQSSLVLRDKLIRDLERDDFEACVAPRVDGTQNLIVALEGQPLDSFLMLSSVVGNILGVLGEANYAATNTYLNSLATSNKNNSTHFVAVCPGIIDDVGVIAENDDAKKLLGRQGFQEMRSHDVIALVHYALSEEAKRSGCTEVTSGYRYQSFVQAGRSDALSNSFFSHLLQNANESRGSTVRKSTESIESLMANAKSREDAEAIVSQALASKIRTLVAQSEEEISTKQRVTDLGIDSLVLVELKNWITQTIKVRLQDPEIFDAGSIADLAVLLAERSPLVSQTASSNTTPSIGTEKPQVVNGESDHVRIDSVVDESELPKQPLPELDASLELWLTVVRPGLSDKDYAEAVRLVEDLRRPGGQGRKLQARLTALACDPSVDNWQEELYNKFHYLKMRTPLVPQQNFAGTHYINRQQSAAERAAIIATAAHEFQQHLEGGKVNHQIDRGRKLEKNQYQWLFNTTRQPQRGEDVVKKYPDKNYLVALRRGWVFKIKLGLPLPVLKGHFQRIIVSRCEPASLVGVLTTDDREVWADNRELLQCASEVNAEWLQTIEAAAFVICLDESMPETARDRGHLFLQTGFNRWSDKTMQFVVCDNGMSATIGEHSMIDGYAARRLNSFIQDALESYSKTDTADGHPETTLALEPFSFDLSADLERRIIASQDRLDQRTVLNEFTAFEVSSVGSNFFRRHKIPPTAGVQVAIQLASRKYFGFNPFAHETVGQAHFKKGRIEVGHTVWAETRRFCEAAMNDMTSKGQLRQLYFNATKVQTNNLMRSTQGHGIDRHLLSLEWSVRDGETMPELFTSKVYTESRPKWFMTDCLESGVLEAHYIPAFQGGLWVHFEVDPEKVRFSLWAPVGEGLRFERHLEESTSMVRAILDG